MKKVIYGTKKYYTDELNDDFSDIPVARRDVSENYEYFFRRFWPRVGSWLLGNLIAIPFLYVFAKIKYDFRIIGRQNIKKIKGPYILYSNHSAQFDAVIPTTVINRYRKRTYMVSDPAAVSIPYVRHINKALGALPLPNTYKGKISYLKAVEEVLKKGCCLAIYPEAHIWPYYTKIRPFGSDSFHYPVRFNVPMVPMVITYRKPRGIFKAYKKPRMIINIGEAIKADDSLSFQENKERLRNLTYGFMTRYAHQDDNVALYEYIKKERL